MLASTPTHDLFDLFGLCVNMYEKAPSVYKIAADGTIEIHAPAEPDKARKTGVEGKGLTPLLATALPCAPEQVHIQY